MTRKERALRKAEALIAAADGYADDEKIYVSGIWITAWTARDMADTLIENADDLD